LTKQADRYILSNHARDAIEKRQIQIEWLEQALERPDWTETDPYEPAFEHRLASIEDFGGRVLRVVVNPTVKPIFVITLYFDRRTKRRSG